MPKVGYMCSIDFDEHLEHDWLGVPVFSSVKSIKHHKRCTVAKRSHCGIYKVSIELIRVVKKENLAYMK